jgi:hypothetical protein
MVGQRALSTRTYCTCFDFEQLESAHKVLIDSDEHSQSNLQMLRFIDNWARNKLKEVTKEDLQLAGDDWGPIERSA